MLGAVALRRVSALFMGGYYGTKNSIILGCIPLLISQHVITGTAVAQPVNPFGDGVGKFHLANPGMRAAIPI